MRIFNNFNKTNDRVCPICKTNEDKETVLIVLDGPEDGNMIEATQVHLKCLNLRLSTDKRFIYQLVQDENNEVA